MAASKNNNAPTPDLALPTSIAQTMRLVQRVAHNATWGERIAAHHQLPAAANFGPRLFRRFDAASTPGVWASAFAQRFVADELAPSTTELTLAPYAPAQRQVSAARQGALPWSGGDDFSPSWPTGSIDRSPEPSAHHSLFSDLTTSGWDVQSSAPAQRFATPAPASNAIQPTAQPIRRTPDPQPAAQPTVEPIRRAPDPQPTTQPIRRAPDPQSADQPTVEPSHHAPDPQPAAQPIDRAPDPQPATVPQSQSTLHRQTDTSSAQDLSTLHRQTDTGDTSASGDQGSTEDAAPTSPTPDEPPSIETAATRPMSFFRGTPQNPLMRMGLPESSGDAGDRAATPGAPVSPPSGELPVVRTAKPADQSSLPAVTPTRIDRHAEPTIAPAQPSTPASELAITSSDAAASANVADAPVDIQRAPSDAPTHDDAPPQAAANNSADVERNAVPDAGEQRNTQAPADTSAPPSAPTPASINSQPSVEITRVADDTAAVLGEQGGQATNAADNSTAPPTATAPDYTGSAASDRHETSAHSSSAPTTIARAPIDAAPAAQGSGDATAPAAGTSGSGAANDNTALPNAVAAQPESVINRQAMPSAHPQALDTVLPWATKLLQRYSTGDGSGTSAPMPLLRTYAPTTTMTMMRSSNHVSGEHPSPVAQSGMADGPVNSVLPGVTSASSTHSLPLVRRSAIIPALPQATLQREPATKPSGSIATPGAASAAPSTLDWSALPLLQRLSVQHVVPAAAPGTTASSGSAEGHSVAARLVQRLALDDPQAANAPMPLLQTQAPAQPSTLMRSMAQPGNAGLAGAMPGDAPASAPTRTDSGSPGDQPGSDPGIVADQSAPPIHRSAILPTWSVSASQPLPLLRTHIPDASNAIETSGWKDAEAFQPVSQPASGAPIAQPSSPVAMRAADQQSEPTALPALPGEQSAAGISSTLSSAVPFVHRSAIIPALPQATLQREPATTSGGSISAPGVASAAPPTLDWSALPLLQRLSVQHVVPAAAPGTTTSSGSAEGHSVAARVVQRLGLDDPHGTSAPMPLLRMQAPSDMPTVNRAVDSDQAGADVPETHSSTAEAAAPVLPALIRRSAILPSLSSFAPPEPGSAPPAISGAETDPLQRSTIANDWGAPPILQRSFGAFAGGLNRLRSRIPTLPSPASALGGLGQSLGGLEQHAQSALGQMTSGLPSPASALGGLGGLEQRAQSALGQATSGLPSPASALGGLGQSLGGLEQHAQSALGQVTSAMPQLPLLQQMNWRSAQQALGIPNLGIPNIGIPNMGIPNLGLPNMGIPNMGIPGLDNPGEDVGAESMPDMAAGVGESPLGAGPAPELPLLRPTRPEPQAAPEQSQSASPDGGATSESASATSGTAKDAADPAGKQGKHDIEQLAQQVYARLRHRLLVDRERLGPF